MREIKFRAWDTEGKKMFLPTSEDGWRIVLGEIYSKPDTILMQFTGLKDKNGKDIFEGDIIKVNGRNMEVFFKDGYFGWGQEHDGKYSFDPFGDEKIEVIGNIYENPELIK